MLVLRAFGIARTMALFPALLTRHPPMPVFRVDVGLKETVGLWIEDEPFVSTLRVLSTGLGIWNRRRVSIC